MKFIGWVAATAALAEGHVQCKNKKSLLQKRAAKPGTGMDLGKLEPFKKSFKDGFFHVGCLNEGMRFDADKHSDQGSKRYAAQNVEVSIVRYESLVPKEDRKDMTPGVCFNFCRSLEEDIHFFGIVNGRDCYCTPYYKAKAGGEGEQCDMPCDGDNTQTCGGKNKSDIYEMHFCQDTVDDLHDLIHKGRVFMGALYEPLENLGSCASTMQYIGGMTQVYGGQAGDTVAGDQGQSMKVKSGEHYRVARTGVKSYKKLEQDLNKLETAVTWDFSDAAKAAEVDEIQRDFKKFLNSLEDDLNSVREARNSCAGYRGVGHANRVLQYDQIGEHIKQYNSGGNNSTDSFCSSKGEVLATFEGSPGDCAFKCDRTLHPKKCVAFQHYSVVSTEKTEASTPPEYVYCSYWGPNGDGGSITDGQCSYVSSVERSEAYDSKVGQENFDTAYGDFIVEGPVTMSVKITPNPEFCFETWWSDMGVDYRVEKLCGEDVYMVEDADGSRQVTVDELQKMEWKFEQGSHMLQSDYYEGFTGSRPVEYVLHKVKDTSTGICALLEEVQKVSYYSCPDQKESSGENAKCMIKVSESKGFEAKKAVDNQRCLISKKVKIPDLVPFDFRAEKAKAKVF